jgi:serine/threonine protein kinase
MERIGRYAVERIIARGGMAEVFLARVEGPSGFVKKLVIKRILPELSEDPEFVGMFLDEARLAALLNHPNIVQVYDFGDDNGRQYIAMEHIEGDTVRNAIRYHKSVKQPFPPKLAIQILIDACEGLHYAHGLCNDEGVSHNIVHRDVSPENILMSSSGVAKIVDFGIAKAASKITRTEAGKIKGKYAYMAPELLRGEPIDCQLDVYALGVTLFEMLALKRPFDGDSEVSIIAAVLGQKATPLMSLNPSVPEPLVALIAKAMSSDRATRFPNALALQGALEDYLASTGERVSRAELAALVKAVEKYRKSKKVDPTPSGA